jgi:hypothetical protein
MLSVSTRYALGMHSACIRYGLGMYSICTYTICTRYALVMHSVYTRYALDVHSVCTRLLGMFPVCTRFTQALTINLVCILRCYATTIFKTSRTNDLRIAREQEALKSFCFQDTASVFMGLITSRLKTRLSGLLTVKTPLSMLRCFW